MKILDRYILKRYLGSFFFILLLSSMLIVVVDAAEKIEDFLAEGGPTAYEVIVSYYMNFVPFINGLIFPLYNLIAVVFFTSRLASNSEFIAMVGNGVNHYRLLVPYLLGASIIAGLHFYGNHYLFPVSNKTRAEFENTYIYKHNFVGKPGNFHAAISPYEEIYLQGFNRYDSTGSQFAWIKHDSSKLKRTSVWTATKVRLLTPPNRWRLTGVRKRERVSDFEDRVEMMGPQNFIDTTIGMYITDLIKRDNRKDVMTTPDLIVYIDKQKAKGTGGTLVFEVERYRRSADPFSIFILTLIGFSIASRKMRGGMAWHLVIGFGLSAIYIFLTKFSTTFSISGGLSPMVGVWGPNIFFMGVALYMLLRAQK